MRIITYEEIYGDDDSDEQKLNEKAEEINELILSGVKKINHSKKTIESLSDELNAFTALGSIDLSLGQLNRSLNVCKNILIGEFDDIIDDILSLGRAVTKEEVYDQLQSIRKEMLTKLKQESDL